MNIYKVTDSELNVRDVCCDHVVADGDLVVMFFENCIVACFHKPVSVFIIENEGKIGTITDRSRAIERDILAGKYDKERSDD